MDVFLTYNVSQLQEYLKDRGVTHSKAKKADLIELCQLDVDPNCFLDDINKTIQEKLFISGKALPNPNTMDGTNDMSLLPDIDNFDIYNYLINFKEQYLHKQLKDFKNLDGYQLYKAGYVKKIEVVSDIGVDGYCSIKFLVKPKQRKEDPINKTPFYKGWIILDSSEPSVHSAYCACKGGSDGGCRHTVACLFEIAEYSNINNDLNKSVTSEPCLWKRMDRRSTDNPVPSDELSTKLPGSSRSEPPTAEFYDPCPEFVLDVEGFYDGLKVLQPNAAMLLNRFVQKPTKTPLCECSILPFIDLAHKVVKENSEISTLSEMLELISYSQDELAEIERCTRGQANNELWMNFRKGMITASSFHGVSRLKDTTNPDKLIRFLMEGNNFTTTVPASLQWSKKELAAQKIFLKAHRKEHGQCKFLEKGLIVNKTAFYMGASPDGLCQCKKCGHFLVEIKCPYTKRNFSPRLAAKDHCYEDDMKILHLDPKSSWYYQIQGQLGIAEMQLCKLVIYTMKGITVVDVPLDEVFWNDLEETLNKFYITSFGLSTLKLLKSSNYK